MTHDTGRHGTPHIKAKAFAFDLEGTLVDLEAHHFLAFERAMGDLGLRITMQEIAAFPGAIGGGDLRIAKLLKERYSLAADKESILMLAQAYFDEAVRDEPMKPRLFVTEVIEKVLSMGYKVAMGSVTPRSRGKIILERSGLDIYFKKACFFEDVKNGKPDGEVYCRTAELLEVEPQQQIVFEDSVPGVLAAKAAGSEVIAVPSGTFHHGGHLAALHEAGASEVFMSWREMLQYLDDRF